MMQNSLQENGISSMLIQTQNMVYKMKSYIMVISKIMHKSKILGKTFDYLDAAANWILKNVTTAVPSTSKISE